MASLIRFATWLETAAPPETCTASARDWPAIKVRGPLMTRDCLLVTTDEYLMASDGL